MKTVVVTGSSEGIGLGLAKELLKKGCSVVLASRTKSKLEAVSKELSAEFGSDKIMIQACDVAKFNEVEDLWKAAKDKFGTIDILPPKQVGHCLNSLKLEIKIVFKVKFHELPP